LLFSDIAQLNRLFNICTPLDPNNWLDVATFMSTLMGNFMGVVQYNDDNRRVKVMHSHFVLIKKDNIGQEKATGAKEKSASYSSLSLS
jgi:hypothetical protein